MESRWQYVTIARVSEKIVMEPFSSWITVRSFVSEGVPVISGQHVHGSRLDDKSFNFISLEHANGRASGSVRQGDATSTHATNNAQVAHIPETSQYNRYVVSQRQSYMMLNRPWLFLSISRTALQASASCWRGNMSIKLTRSHFMSINSCLFDTFTLHVHGVDMKALKMHVRAAQRALMEPRHD